MNSLPIIFLFFSGSVTPDNFSKNLFSASTLIKCIPEFLKASSTSSPSFFRNSPWSTKMQVKFFPTALDRSEAVTDESTPPDRASKTFPSPTFSFISAIDFFA